MFSKRKSLTINRVPWCQVLAFHSGKIYSLTTAQQCGSRNVKGAIPLFCTPPTWLSWGHVQTLYTVIIALIATHTHTYTHTIVPQIVACIGSRTNSWKGPMNVKGILTFLNIQYILIALFQNILPTIDVWLPNKKFSVIRFLLQNIL